MASPLSKAVSIAVLVGCASLGELKKDQTTAWVSSTIELIGRYLWENSPLRVIHLK
jgi:hypothetical protein